MFMSGHTRQTLNGSHQSRVIGPSTPRNVPSTSPARARHERARGWLWAEHECRAAKAMFMPCTALGLGTPYSDIGDHLPHLHTLYPVSTVSTP